MVQTSNRSLDGKLSKRNYLLIAVIASSLIMGLLVLTMFATVLATPPL